MKVVAAIDHALRMRPKSEPSFEARPFVVSEIRKGVSVSKASELRVYWRLQLAAHFMQKYSDREMSASANITTAQIGVLTVIANQSAIRQKDVATELGLNESAVTPMVRRLVRDNYIERTVSESDGRAKILTLTKAGKAVQRSAKPPFVEINSLIESTLTEQEIEQLTDVLNRLRTTFEEALS